MKKTRARGRWRREEGGQIVAPLPVALVARTTSDSGKWTALASGTCTDATALSTPAPILVPAFSKVAK
jgi:hypothetical protein